jgi:hypothetical protein
VAYELLVAESVGNVLPLLLLLDGDVVLVSFGVVEVPGDGSVSSLLFPLDKVIVAVFSREGSLGDESISIGWVSEVVLWVLLLPLEPQILQIGLFGSVFVEVGVYSSDSSFVGSIEVTEGIPDLFLDGQIVFEVIDDLVVGFDFNLIVVLVQFAVDVVLGGGVLMGE